MDRGFILDEVAQIPPNCFQEGAGDLSGIRPADGSGPATVNARRDWRPQRFRPSSAGTRWHSSSFRRASIISTSASAP
jgi:hypothetical protein